MWLRNEGSGNTGKHNTIKSYFFWCYNANSGGAHNRGPYALPVLVLRVFTLSCCFGGMQSQRAAGLTIQRSRAPPPQTLAAW